MFDNAGQDDTSVLTKTARGFFPASLCSVMSASASGRRPRSAITTLQFRDKRSAAKDRLIPFQSMSVDAKRAKVMMGRSKAARTGTRASHDGGLPTHAEGDGPRSTRRGGGSHDGQSRSVKGMVF